jgi:GntR family transcriptional repressor for pyruvate dehydrogenase complex
MNRRQPANVELTRELLTYLTTSDVSPGQRLPGERALSEALGVGRANLREAIKSLILLGVLEQQQGNGTFLARHPSSLLPQVIEWGVLIGRHEVDDLVQARQVLEVQLAELAAHNRSDEALARLRSSLDDMRAAGNDHDAYIEADTQFHIELAAASGNTVLAGVLSNIRSLVHAWAERVIRAAQETETSLAMHEPVFAAVEAGDPAAARDAMQALMDRASRRLAATMREIEAGSNR